METPNKFEGIDVLVPKGVFAWIVVITLIATVTIGQMMYHLQKNLMLKMAIRDADNYITVLQEFRDVYTTEVILKIKDSSVEVTHDYHNKTNAIPLPITLTEMLGNQIKRTNETVETRLFSAYPFPWRAETGGPQDSFDVQALTILEQNPGEAYYQFLEEDGQEVLRYAKADIMKPGCIDCHNKHPLSPKTDWKVGDLRGVLEIKFPVENVEHDILDSIKESLILLALILLGGGVSMFIMGNWFKRLKQKRQQKQ